MNKLVPVEYQGQRILITEQLAEVYKTEPRRITENFQRNQERFILGKHYHLLEGEALREFKRDYAESVVAPNVNKLYLLTERGASRHCKILDTDKAWEQFDHLEETYFNPKRKPLTPPTWKEIAANVKAKRDLYLTIGMPTRVAISKALDAEERESGVDLSEFRIERLSPAASRPQIDLNLVIEALRAAISNRDNVYRHEGGRYVLVREGVYAALDERGLNRKDALATLHGEGVLERDSTSHYTRQLRAGGGRGLKRAFFVRIDEGDEG